MSNSGCEVLDKLWNIAVNDIEIDKPGSSGAIPRVTNAMSYQNMEYSWKLAEARCKLELKEAKIKTKILELETKIIELERK